MPGKEDILKQVRGALEHEPRVNLHRYPVSLDLDSDGTLTLEGDVADIAAKKLALELAASISGVSGIVDRLRLAPTEPMGDGAIRDHIRDALLQDSALEGCSISVRVKEQMETCRESAAQPPARIEVSVNDGVVTLNGRVSSLSHKRLAGLMAWWVPGSRDVINGLEVLPPEDDTDDEITDAVRAALEKDPFVNPDRMRVSTRNCVVTLDGFALNQKEKEMAEIDAWYIFGVDKVVNRLETLQ